MKHQVTLKKLIEYCERNRIFIPSRPTRLYLTSAIIRYRFNGEEFHTKNCLGWWEDDCYECNYCEHEEKCFTVSIGMTREEYNKQLGKIE